jgi:hypothetical protein
MFWPTNLAVWFAMAKGQILLRGISDKTLRHYHVLPCLQEVHHQPRDFVEGTTAWGSIHTAEVVAPGCPPVHQLPKGGADFPAHRGALKLSEMLTEMLRLCLEGQEGSLFFTYLFPHRRELRILLIDISHTDRHVLADEADQLGLITLGSPTARWRL